MPRPPPNPQERRSGCLLTLETPPPSHPQEPGLAAQAVLELPKVQATDQQPSLTGQGSPAEVGSAF